jgi:hypothetical protein
VSRSVCLLLIVRNITMIGRSQWPRGPEAWVCGRSLAAIVSLNPAECIPVCLL